MRYHAAVMMLVLATAAPCMARDHEVKDVLLVHGAWADATMWSSVITKLQNTGLTVHAAQLCLTTLQEDAGVVRQAIQDIGKPVVVVGHSFGGAVITKATGSGDLPNVTALVYAAGFAPAENETLLQQAESGRYELPGILPYLRFDSAGFTTLDPTGFVKVFASTVSRPTAAMLAVVQKRTSSETFGENMTTPGYLTFPTYYQVSTEDQVIRPPLQEFFAQRMGAVEVLRIKTGHLSIVTHPGEIASLILRAAAAGSRKAGRKLAA